MYEGAGPKDVAAIFYTSGTTGFPKGAMHTHENVLANVETAFRVCGIPAGLGADLRTLVVVPLFHVTGCHSQALVALRGGGAVVIDSAFDGARMIDTLDHERISACTAVPAIYYFILNHPSFAPSRMSAVRWVSYGGAPIAPALVERIAESFPSSRVGQRVRADRDRPRSPRSCRTSGRRSTPTRSGSRRRTPRWRSRTRPGHRDRARS